MALFIAAVGVLAVAVASAQSRPVAPRPPRPSPAFAVRVETAFGEPLAVFRHGGQDWLLGEFGERYVIVVENPTSERVEAVVSVDGRDAISGRVASFRRDRGYVVPAFGTTRIEGFRQSLDDVASFRFTRPEDSYSARRGTPQNVGVIGVAFFRERREAPLPREPLEESDARRAPRPAKPHGSGARGRAAPSSPRAESDANLGTEYGETRASPVREVRFERASNTPVRVIRLRYDDALGLEARGIDVSGRFDPFPPFDDFDRFDRFAPPPPPRRPVPDAFPRDRR
jgi:hypothetical protein